MSNIFQPLSTPWPSISELLDFDLLAAQAANSAPLLSQILVLLTGIFAVIYALLFIVQFTQILTIGAFAQILEVFGFIKVNKPQGFVFDSETYEPIPFALITIESISTAQLHETNDADNPPQIIRDTLVSGSDGLYRGVNLPIGLYRFQAKKDGYSFPTLKPRSPLTSVPNFYRGETISVTSEIPSQQLLIPLDREDTARAVSAPTSPKRLFRNKVTFFLAKLQKSFNKIMIGLWILSLLTALIIPSIFNYLLLAIYTLLAIISLTKFFRRPRISGQVLDENNQPLAGAIVRLTIIESNQLVSLAQTDKNGRFKFFVKKDIYQVSVFKNNYLRDTTHPGQGFSLDEINARQKPQKLVLRMKRATQTAEEFFAE